MQKVSGAEIAQKIIEQLKSEPKPEKILAVILVSKNPSSISFIKQKEKIAKELNVDFRLYEFPEEIKNDDLRKEVLKISLLKKVGGVIVQLPLPEHINQHYILNVIPREKDIDVLGERALGAFYTDRNLVLPPAVGVVDAILTTCNLQLATFKVVVIGRGLLVGKPIAVWLLNKVAELTVFNSSTRDLRDKLKPADLIISGVGKVNLFSAEDLNENAMVIDFGYDMSSGKISGDFNYETNEANKLKAIRYTPTPRGTGPILVAKVFENFYRLNAEK